VAKNRPAVPAAIKRSLLEEAGGRCINPGCPSERAHIHHIEEWSVYETHDARTMIALCPTCHDAVHHAEIEIPDRILLSWKRAGKGPRKSDYLYLEPGEDPILKLGAVTLRGGGHRGFAVLSPSPQSRLSFRIEGGDLALVSCRMADRNGSPIVQLDDNRLRLAESAEAFRYASIPGHMVLEGPPELVLDDWMIEGVRSRFPDFGEGIETILEAEAIAAGQIRIRGIWRDGDRALVIREEGWVVPSKDGGASLMDTSEEGGPTLIWQNPGPIDVGPGFFETVFKIW
jgi:hypothetical protein